jgi:NitT/TauT family transport system ATP-binding protein
VNAGISDIPPVETGQASTFIEFEEASITYGRGAKAVQALAPTSLKIAEGEFVALVGPSGCGKSTILKMVGELLKPSTGHVFVAGREIGATPIRIGMAYQNPTLLPWLNIRDNVMLPLKIVPPFRQGYRSKRKGEYRDRVEALLAQVGLGGFGDKYPWQLSGGMRMRVSIARALSVAPEILLLDEPFGALDEMTRDRLNEDLLAIRSRAPFTGFFVTHSVAEAVFLSSRIVVLGANPGRVTAVIDVPFAYPRQPELRESPPFLRLLATTAQALRAVRSA